MSDGTVNDRLMKLATALDRLRTTPGIRRAASVPDEAALIDGIPDARLRTLTDLLRRRVHEPDIDAEDAMLLRLLLDDYAAAVRNLRSVASGMDERLASVRSLIAEGRRLLRED